MKQPKNICKAFQPKENLSLQTNSESKELNVGIAYNRIGYACDCLPSDEIY